MTKELTEEQFIHSFGNEMIDLTQTELEDPVDIWNYVSELVEIGLVNKVVLERNLVEAVYRNDLNTFDHVLLPTDHENIYVVIVIDLEKKDIFGHQLLNLHNKYDSCE